jgi:hypothetical protein
MELADAEVSAYLRLVQRINPALSPPVSGQVAAVKKDRGDGGDAASMSASMMEEFEAADGLGAMFGAQKRGDGDTMSVGSKGSAMSKGSVAGESSTEAAKNHPARSSVVVRSAFARG